MEESILTRFIPKLGDRVALNNFLVNQNPQRESLIEKLKRKILDKNKSHPKRGKKKNKVDEGEPSCSGITEKKSLKPTRIVEFGWTIDGAQIRKKCGGGTRKIAVGKSWKKDELMEKAKQLFFPNGISSKGPLSKYKFQLLDFKSNDIENDLTVEQMYDITGLTSLRFYLSCEIDTTLSKTRSKMYDDTIFADSDDDVTTEHDATLVSDSNETTVITNNNQDLTSLISDLSSNNANVVLLQDSDSFQLRTPSDDNLDVNEFLTFYPEVTGQVEVTDQVEVTGQVETRKIILHRGHVFDEMLEYLLSTGNEFSNICLEVQFKLPNGETESAFDGGGVLRDALTEFWNTFYSSCCTGTSCKVPYIRHDFDEQKWKAIGKVLFIGYKQMKYFPWKLARPFMEYAVFGQCFDVLESFLNYLGPSDAATVRAALQNYEDTDTNELMDIMDALECRTSINKNNFNKVIYEIGHKEIIQKPMYVIECWQNILKHKFTPNQFVEIYETKTVTNRNVLQLLTFLNNDNAPDETRISRYLKQYVREAQKDILEKFLRFCTGADAIVVEAITVSFNNTTGLQRSPVAHTCNSLLELSVDYKDYTEFQHEFNNILSSNVWIMDII